MKIKAKLNEMIANEPLPEKRKLIQEIGTLLLLALGVYNGFNYADWINGGYQRWVQDGKPKNNTPYLGDQTKIVFN